VEIECVSVGGKPAAEVSVLSVILKNMGFFNHLVICVKECSQKRKVLSGVHYNVAYF